MAWSNGPEAGTKGLKITWRNEKRGSALERGGMWWLRSENQTSGGESEDGVCVWMNKCGDREREGVKLKRAER